MAAGEGEIIERYFRHLGAVRTDVALGIGDDAALLRPAPGCELVQSTDALVEQVHFLPGSAPRSLGHRALAVNLSDLAAMGATPAWALLSLTLPRLDESWLGEFASGFARLAREHEVALVGGNLSRGPLSITVQLTGQVPQGTALRRSGARAGDELWVSGTLGDAAQGLVLRRAESRAESRAQAPLPDAGGHAAWLCARFEYPSPRVALGLGLRQLASACIDLSDGLLADLPRLAAASGCRAEVDTESLPLSPALRAVSGDPAWQQALAGGEDYELCFTAGAAQAPQLQELATAVGVPLCRCGRLREGSGLELRRAGTVIQFAQPPFDHFGA
ncbi:MAG TPA: thiamine-phosphate kinase [Steroidobacteraceae bacterium]